MNATGQTVLNENHFIRLLQSLRVRRVAVAYSNKEKEELKKEINELISDSIGPIAKLSKIQFSEGLPKTRSGKIMRRILRKIAAGELHDLGDTSTLLNPDCVEEIIKNRQ